VYFDFEKIKVSFIMRLFEYALVNEDPMLLTNLGLDPLNM